MRCCLFVFIAPQAIAFALHTTTLCDTVKGHRTHPGVLHSARHRIDTRSHCKHTADTHSLSLYSSSVCHCSPSALVCTIERRAHTRAHTGEKVRPGGRGWGVQEQPAHEPSPNNVRCGRSAVAASLPLRSSSSWRHGRR
uniref:Putative secreted protein n=1 Tax=Anopheles darlingi TaxID=43151 RepID=A0A2M4D801_ANODA